MMRAAKPEGVVTVSEDPYNFEIAFSNWGVVGPWVIKSDFRTFITEQKFYKFNVNGTDEIKNANLQKEDFGDFIQTYFYKINKYEFDDETFRETCVALERRIKRKYSKKSFFFIPLWSFSSEIEFEIEDIALN